MKRKTLLRALRKAERKAKREPIALALQAARAMLSAGDIDDDALLARFQKLTRRANRHIRRAREEMADKEVAF